MFPVIENSHEVISSKASSMLMDVAGVLGFQETVEHSPMIV